MEATSVKTRNAFREWAIWGTLFIVPFIFYPGALTSSWVSNSDVHSLLEFWAAAIGFIAAGIVLIHFFATGRKFFLLISLGFTLQGTEDLVHAIYSFSRIWPAEQRGIVNFVPGTYVAGRLLLISCILLALYFEKKATVKEKRGKEAIKYNTIGFSVAALVTIIIINSPLPRFILPGHIISRPVDFTAALIYLGTLFYLVRMYRKEEYRTPFVWSITGSLICGFAAQVYMVHSQQLYDAQFDISHVLKILSYIFPIGGIAVGIFSMYKREETLSEDLHRKTDELVREIVELKRAEEKIKELARFVSENPNPILKISKDCKILYANNASSPILEAWGCKEGQRLPPPYSKVVDKVLDSGKAVTYEVNFHDRVFSVTIAPVVKSGYVNVYGLDITELTLSKEHLKQAREQAQIKSQFVSTVSHELRTPLTTMKEGVNIVLDGVAGEINNKQRHFLNIAKRNIDRLARFINDVLDLQKLEAGKMEVNMQRNNMNEVVEEAIETMASAADEKGLELTARLDETMPTVNFDRDRIIQVLVNLVDNAIKFTEKGNITIATTKGDNTVRISVRDTGAGIKNEDLPKLFHEFEQLSDSDERITGGSGLGLAISRRIIQEHNGKIWAESEFGKGTTFYFELPVQKKKTLAMAKKS